MTTALLTLAVTVAAYLIGSLSFAVIVSRVMGLHDPRSYGSGNPGATNVLRSGNKKAAVLTLVFDLLKGLIPVVLVLQFGEPWNLRGNTAALVGLAAFLGHLWPVFFRFQGGKGVATAAGVLLGLHAGLGLAVLAIWIAVAFATRYSSLAALIASIAAPIVHIVGWGPSGATLAITLMSALLVWRHRANIGKLMAGTESKLGQKSSPAAPAATASHGHSAGHHKDRGHGRKR
ncbi:glycerol-3-phosphate 1-O-acyltransferase PlsY [Sphaerotilus mobilis]|uniref:Glycerol-3-phosphate acyltransferase n=1 Tax=Sphaerotilus mobilis TaxID=47994 RepID=A0A4V2EWT1_9BURK|nr:glycerol-3-phosphate 1-O-acyltransferase PlsY [Sphaerotilus mobilis]RZS57070.1 acyl-phosphate glycerol-3-phosphate acyltransferase [Sphaerotilus mobilis]